MTEPRRITDAAATPNAADVGMLRSITPIYPSVCGWNLNNEYLLLVTDSGYFRLHDGNGRYLEDLPFYITLAKEPRWSRTDPNIVYYVVGNQIRFYDVATRRAGPVKHFPEYLEIYSKGEADISADGTSMVLIGNERDVFVYNIRTGEKRMMLDAAGAAIESLYITGDNEVLVSSAAGMSLYGEDSLSAKGWGHLVAPVNAHKDICDDADGNPTLVWCCSADASMDCNGIVATRLRDGRRTILATLPWHLGFHVAAPDNAGFVFVSTYHDPNSQLTKDCGPSEFDDAILKVPLDGSGITKLADTGSIGDSYECGQPRATCDRAGTRIVWGSNQGGATVDTFLLNLAADSPRTQKPSKPGKKRRGN